MFRNKTLVLIPFVILLMAGCSDDSPAPSSTSAPKVLSEVEKVICGNSYKTWKFVAIYKNNANVIRDCAVNDDWIFRYSRILEIKNNGLSCDGQDAFQEHDWDISGDEKSIIIGASSFVIVKMTSTEMQLQENVDGNPVFVFKR